MEYFELLRYRKSTRRFREGQITGEELSALLAAANSAPVGSNRYGDIHLSVVQSRDILDLLSRAAVRRWQDKDRMREIVGDLSKADTSRELADPFYAAPTVIFVSHRKQDAQPGIEFANVACVAMAMHLAATDLGLGSVLMWFALESMREIPALDHTAALGLPEGFVPLIGLAVGYPAKALIARESRTDKIATDML